MILYVHCPFKSTYIQVNNKYVGVYLEISYGGGGAQTKSSKLRTLGVEL